MQHSSVCVLSRARSASALSECSCAFLDVMMLLLGALALGFSLHVSPPAALASQCSLARNTPTLMLAQRDSWSIGKSRRKGKTKEKVAKPLGRGFGQPPEAEVPVAKVQPAVDAADTNLAPADLNANDLQEAAAAAGGETWRAYANEALAQVAALEAEAEAKAVSAAELLARQSALAEAAARRGGAKQKD